ncbi:hypothetical protein MPS01_12370 [Marinilactibacillus psychrotolerans]|uniref:LPXTG cell wall anchor domain-containing protein n=1 Tax=Marinilactibacillus psychrotolerans TaxID=191770 RepID=A0AAV3WVQ8_9LACT|nr:hypothetical protein MPS01_12370 [Marinilactibacillus psychrotolerans]GEQ36227.1 hypothetical protein M132T_17350 [Marinilactibacillus psychrotolerans]
MLIDFSGLVLVFAIALLIGILFFLKFKFKWSINGRLLKKTV